MRLEHVYDSVRRVGQEEGPVETEDHNSQQDGNNHLVHRLDGGHAPYDGQAGSDDGKSMEEYRPA